jgi:hypothetical protein
MAAEREIPGLSGDALTVMIVGKPGVPDRTLIIRRGEGTEVTVQEWNGANVAGPAMVRRERATTLVATLERAMRDGHRLSAEIGDVRRWLRLERG